MDTIPGLRAVSGIQVAKSVTPVGAVAYRRTVTTTSGAAAVQIVIAADASSGGVVGHYESFFITSAGRVRCHLGAAGRRRVGRQRG